MENKRKRFQGNAWYQQLMHTRTKNALLEQDAAFEREHGRDSDAQLLDYVRGAGKACGHAPKAFEVAGAETVIRRFGTWAGALERAGLGRPEPSLTLAQSKRYKAEYARQQERYRREKKTRDEQRRLREEQRRGPKKAGEAEP